MSSVRFNKVFNTLHEAFEHHIQKQPEKIIYHFLEKNRQETLTYETLYSYAAKIAASLQKQVNPGDCVLLMFEPGLNFIKSFFGCMLAGIIAVPVKLPNSEQSSTKINTIIENCQPSLLLCDQNSANKISRLSDQSAKVHQISKAIIETICETSSNQSNSVINTDANEDTIVLLQYTSGSTSEPKGVIITHRNICSNISIIIQQLKVTNTDIGVSWLPYFHDMGLIGNLLMPFYAGITIYLISPITFIKDPLTWLKLIHDTKATLSSGPNFAYQYCVKYLNASKKDPHINLSTWRIALNGSEPIDMNTINSFDWHFKKFGFKKSAFYPSYGLAESTLYVSGQNFADKNKVLALSKEKLRKDHVELLTQDQRVDKNAIQYLVSVGPPPINVKIVDRNTHTLCSEAEIGEIWVSHHSVSEGYWKNPEATSKTFKNTIQGDKTKIFYLRTGDLGFIYQNQLYVTGRIKELIIIRGHNYYPQDIERDVMASNHSDIQNAYAFSIDNNNQEGLVVVAEAKKNISDHTAILNQLAESIIIQHGINPFDVVLTPRNTLPFTSSGKKQRIRCKELYLKHELRIIASLNKSDGV
ncbi:TPA: fatty acyl-AMP ligase [Legionella anisa]